MTDTQQIQDSVRPRHANPADTAKRVRADLKGAWPGTKFSVRTRNGSTICVDWTDGPRETAVETLLAKYEHGYFDGMDDSYHYTTGNVVDGIDYSVRFLFTNRHYSDTAEGRFRALLLAYLDGLAAQPDYEIAAIVRREMNEWDATAQPLPATIDDLPSRQHLAELVEAALEEVQP